MSDLSKHTAPYAAADIQRYLKGEMSAREMHQLEKAALEDPFLADALEGFEMEPPTLDQHLEDLQQRLQTRVAEKPAKQVVLFPPWLKVAASIILLIGLGLGVSHFFMNGRPMLNIDKEPPVSSARVSPVTSTPPVAAQPAVSDSVTGNMGLVSVEKKSDQEKEMHSERKASLPKQAASSAQAAPSSQAAPSAQTPSSSRQTAPPAALARSSAGSKAKADDETKTITADSLSDIAANVPNPSLKIEQWQLKKDTASFGNADYRIRGYANVFKRADSRTRPLVFSGKVLDVNNKPLPGATLNLNGGSNGYTSSGFMTTTDKQGNFSLKVNPTDSVLRVTVGLVGYRQASMDFNTMNTDAFTGKVIYLQQQDNALNEVVVVGYGAKRKETLTAVPAPSDEKLDSAWKKAAPVIGKQAYLDYLAVAKKTIGADSTIKGTVIISFDVNKKGERSAFKVEQSLTPAHDAGVIHLVSEGPSWKLSKGRSVRAAVRVVF